MAWISKNYRIAFKKILTDCLNFTKAIFFLVLRQTLDTLFRYDIMNPQLHKINDLFQ